MANFYGGIVKDAARSVADTAKDAYNGRGGGVDGVAAAVDALNPVAVAGRSIRDTYREAGGGRDGVVAVADAVSGVSETAATVRACANGDRTACLAVAASAATAACAGPFSGRLVNRAASEGRGRLGQFGSRLTDETGAIRIPVKTQWGWSGSRSYREAVSAVDQGGTLETVGGRIPTQAEAEMLIEDAGGTVQRIEGAHQLPNPHQYQHINYTTSSGAKGTVQIQP